MKYIRTKDGIYRNASVPTDLVIICRDRECEVNPSDIIKQADAIDELCDEIVVVNNWGKHTTQHFCDRLDRSTFVGNEKPYELNNTKVFGAIWTDKGLIYVAKMNDKGELELL